MKLTIFELLMAFTAGGYVSLLTTSSHLSLLSRPRTASLLLYYYVILSSSLSLTSGALFHGLESSFIVYEKWNGFTLGSISFDFKTDQSQGMVFYMDTKATNNYYMMVYIKQGDLVFEYQASYQKQSCSFPRVNNTLWNRVSELLQPTLRLTPELKKITPGINTGSKICHTRVQTMENIVNETPGYHGDIFRLSINGKNVLQKNYHFICFSSTAIFIFRRNLNCEKKIFPSVG